ncbi:hypothetical protein [Nocardioides bigeumensis]|uniref:DUF4446 family protein n=1 Tax=Nocardioides bigeumensis TaxID=433657 RepID=A0ABN2Y5M3_9ACTN
MSEWVVWVPVTLLALGFLALAAALHRDRSRRREELAAAYAVIADLQERVDELEARPGPLATGAGASSSTAGAVVITRIDEPAPASDHRIDGSLFADLVLRESLVKGVSLAYGVGRALSPETRHRIRFLMRQEVKRARKQRRADVRAARRHLADLQRAGVHRGEDAA